MPGDADGGEFGVVHEVSGLDLVFVVHVVIAVAMEGVVLLVLFEGDFGGGDPEGFVDADGGCRILVGVTVRVTHLKLSGGDTSEVDGEVFAEVQLEG